MTLFRLDASILPATSASRELGDLVEAEWLAAHPSSTVVRRDVAADPVPATAWRDSVTSGFTPAEAQTDGHREAIALRTQLADELIGADALLFTVPLYNYGVSQHVKTWFDLAYTDPRIDPTGTALHGKAATLVTVLGGNYEPGSPRRGGIIRRDGSGACSRMSGVSTSRSSTARSRSSASIRLWTRSRTRPQS